MPFWNNLESLRVLSQALLIISSLSAVLAAAAAGARLYIDHRATVISSEAARANQQQSQERLEGLQTGGDSFCYFMLYDFDLDKRQARQLVVIRKGRYPLYDVRLRVHDMDSGRDLLERPWAEANAAADFLIVKWPLTDNAYYRIFFQARNGGWHQDLILRKSVKAQCWLAATRVSDRSGSGTVLEHIDSEYVSEFGNPLWRK